MTSRRAWLAAALLAASTTAACAGVFDLRSCPADVRARVLDSAAAFAARGYAVEADRGVVLVLAEGRPATDDEVARLLAGPPAASRLMPAEAAAADLSGVRAGASASASGEGRRFWDGSASAGDVSRAPAAAAPYEFARRYRPSDMADPLKRDEFLREAMFWEGQFEKPGVGYNGVSGLTYDGHDLDASGEPAPGGPRAFTAPSKESIHVSILAKALLGDPYAALLVSADDPARARAAALDLLRRKISSYEKFNREYPGFGGFAPWVDVSDAGMKPRPDWKDSVPGLDAGELVWSLMAVVEALKKAGQPALAARYQAQIDLMARNVGRMFFDPKAGKLRVVAKMEDPKKPPRAQRYEGAQGFLEDPYEGELLALFWSLYGKPKPADVRRVWKEKAPRAVDVETKAGPITIRQGWQFSSHEEWNLLVAPYLDEPLVRRVMTNNQRLRTRYSAERGITGLFGAAHEPHVPLRKYYTYGIPGAGSSPTRADAVTPYGAFPVMLVDREAGLAWYLATLRRPGMQGPLGAGESSALDGSAVAPVATWDTKETAALAAIGGSADLAAKYLRRTGRERKFRTLLHDSYARGFAGVTLKGESLPIVPPPGP